MNLSLPEFNFAKALYIIVTVLLCPLFLTSCVKRKTNIDPSNEIVIKDSLIYKVGSDVPFTGREVAKVRDGKTVEYDVVKGKKNGDFKVLYPNGKTLMEGGVINNRNEGMWKYYFTNSQLESQGAFKNDTPSGKWTFYYPNGVVEEEGNYVEGQRDGKWNMYDSTGKLSQVRRFKSGKLLKNK
jgi:antitoxin component YwqK of YwqJK toxin-antitoxin module